MKKVCFKARLIVVSFIVLTILLTLGAGFIAAETKSATLSFWSWRPEDKEAYEGFIAQFNKKYPHIRVEFVPYKNTEYNTIL